jgi:hypothetical protein
LTFSSATCLSWRSTGGHPNGEHFAATCARAYELADGGEASSWNDLANRLRREGFEPHDIKRLERDTLAQLMLRRRIERARDKRAEAPAVLMIPGVAFMGPGIRRVWWEWEAEGDVHEPVLVVETTLLIEDPARHLDARALQHLADAARAHFSQLGFAVGRARLTPAAP